jgi:hypothetical protein
MEGGGREGGGALTCSVVHLVEMVDQITVHRGAESAHLQKSSYKPVLFLNPVRIKAQVFMIKNKKLYC